MSTIFLNIEHEDLIQIFDNPKVKQNIEDLFERILDKKIINGENTQKILGFEETLSFLGISKGTLYKWSSSALIPHYKKGGKLFFIREDLIDWIKSGKVKTNRELDEVAEEFIQKRKFRK